MYYQQKIEIVYQKDILNLDHIIVHMIIDHMQWMTINHIDKIQHLKQKQNTI